MPRILIAYGTREGQTARIAARLADVLRSHGLGADVVDLARAHAPVVEGYAAAIVGGSIHMGAYERRVRDFVRTHRAALERIPSAFFSVSLAAGTDTEAARTEAAGYVETLGRETGWRPARVAHFAGALLYTKYGLVTRWIMRRIARQKGSADLDTSRDYVYTDWDAVARFAEELAGTLAGTLVLEPAHGAGG